MKTWDNDISYIEFKMVASAIFGNVLHRGHDIPTEMARSDIYNLKNDAEFVDSSRKSWCEISKALDRSAITKLS